MFWSFVNRRKLVLAPQTSQPPKTTVHKWHRWTTRSVFFSYHFLPINSFQISALSERTGAAVVAFFSRSNLEDTFELNWICSPNAANFTQEAMTYGMWDISWLLEQWACAKAKGSCTVNTLSMMQKECSAIINGTLSTYFLLLSLL